MKKQQTKKGQKGKVLGKLLKESERFKGQNAINLAKEYQDKLQRAENKSGYLAPDIDTLNNFIDWLTKRRV